MLNIFHYFYLLGASEMEVLKVNWKFSRYIGRSQGTLGASNRVILITCLSLGVVKGSWAPNPKKITPSNRVQIR